MTGERRTFTRRRPADGEPLSRVRLRAGAELEVVDISDSGARARTTSRLLPGTHVDVHLVTGGGRILRRARVARAAVVLVEASRLFYEVALAFDSAVDSSAWRVGATPWQEAVAPGPGESIPTADPPPPQPPQVWAQVGHTTRPLVAPDLDCPDRRALKEPHADTGIH